MKYIPASEVERLAREWDLAGDIEDGADRYELCLAHCGDRLRALLASAVELPKTGEEDADLISEANDWIVYADKYRWSDDLKLFLARVRDRLALATLKARCEGMREAK